jgi:excinuclease ABC subunit C
MKSIEALGIGDKVNVIVIAKRLEEIYFPGDSIPLYINKKSESLKLIQQARNEAHRFAITFHRQKRGKEAIQSTLTTIAGIGEKTAQKLLVHFGSVARLEHATQEDIEKVIGKSKAKVVMEHFGGAISDVGSIDDPANIPEEDQRLDGAGQGENFQSESPGDK